jgi:hypothetical protein
MRALPRGAAPIWIRDARAVSVRQSCLWLAAKRATPTTRSRAVEPDRSAREGAGSRAEGDVRAPAGGRRRTAAHARWSRSRARRAGVGIDATEAETSVYLARTSPRTGARRTAGDRGCDPGADERLPHNTAYRALFQLDPFSRRAADGSAVSTGSDRAPAPEQADFRAWKAQLLEAYRAVEPKEHRWYLPGGRTLRVVTNPNPEHGVTYLFDDISERIELESRFNALNRTQSETLEALTEARRVRHRWQAEAA